MLWELAKHQEVQARLRREVESTRAAVGGAPLTADDPDHMPYLQAVVKVHRDRRLGHLEADQLLCRRPSVSIPCAPRHTQARRGRRLAALRAHQDAVWNLDHAHPTASGNKYLPLVRRLQPVR